MPPGIYLAAKLAMSMVFAGIVSILVMVVAAGTGAGRAALIQWSVLFVLGCIRSVAFSAGSDCWWARCEGQAAPAVINLIYVPMASCRVVDAAAHAAARHRAAAPLWPAYHLLQLAQSVVGAPERSGVGAHLLALGGMAAVFFIAARRGTGRFS